MLNTTVRPALSSTDRPTGRPTDRMTDRPLPPPPAAEPAQRPLPPVDAIDAQLLRQLQDDGRITITRLAELVGLSPAATHDRVARLKREGYILGYEAVLNTEKLATGLLVFAEISINDPAPGIGRAIKAAVQVRHEVIECHEVDGGRFDYLLKTRVPDIYAYRDFVTSVVWKLPGVREVRTYAVIDEIKNTSRIPV